MSTENKTLFVGGISYDIGEEELKQLFHQYGTLTRFDFKDRKRIAFIEFEDYEAAAFAIYNLNGIIKSGQKLIVGWARKNDDIKKKTKSK